MVSSLYVLVEGMGLGDILECGTRWRVGEEAVSQHHDLGELSPGGKGAWPEGVIPITGDSAVTVQVGHRRIEVVGWEYIGEADCARRGNGGVSRAGRRRMGVGGCRRHRRAGPWAGGR